MAGTGGMIHQIGLEGIGNLEGFWRVVLAIAITWLKSRCVDNEFISITGTKRSTRNNLGKLDAASWD